MPENNLLSENKHRRNRPRTITLICSLFLLFGLFNIIKLSQAILQWKTLISLQISISPLYLGISGFVWGISGIVISWSLWVGKSWARKLATGIILLYTITFWIDLIWIAEPTVLQTRWLVNLCLTIIGLPTIYFSLYSKFSQDYFKANPATID